MDKEKERNEAANNCSIPATDRYPEYCLEGRALDHPGRAEKKKEVWIQDVYVLMEEEGKKLCCKKFSLLLGLGGRTKKQKQKTHQNKNEQKNIMRMSEKRAPHEY